MRKSLSSQVLEELGRAGRLLSSVADSVDPIIAHLLGEVAESHRRIETMCLKVQQQWANAVTADKPLVVEVLQEPSTPVRKRSEASHRAPASTRRPKR